MEINLNEILVDVIKLDRNIQESIKREVEEKVVDKIVDEYLKEYFDIYWVQDKDKMHKNIVAQLSEEKEKLIKRVLKEYTEKLGYWSKDKREKAYEEFKKAVEKIEKDLPKSAY